MQFDKQNPFLKLSLWVKSLCWISFGLAIICKTSCADLIDLNNYVGHGAGHHGGMGTMLAGGAVAAAAAYGAHEMTKPHGSSSHGYGGYYGHGGSHGYGHGYGGHGKFKHGKHGKFKHGKHHGGKFKKWK